jgi:hypothetical protein
VTIRAKLYAAIVLTILGPLATTAVALQAMGDLGDRFDRVRARAEHQAVALQLKFDVTDMNGWQTAYGYDRGASRPRFERSADKFRRDLANARRTLTETGEGELLVRLERDFAEFMRLDVVAYRALRAGDARRTKQIFLGPEIVRFEAMAATAEQLAQFEQREARGTRKAFDEVRKDARRRLIAVALGAGFVILLLLVTAADVARMALEGERRMRDNSETN